MKRIPRKAANIQKKSYKRIVDGYGWELGNLVFDKRIRVNGKEIKECGIVDEIVDNSNRVRIVKAKIKT